MAAQPGDALAALDARLGALMGAVRLGYLVEREGGWEAVQEWGEVLSLGERSATQRWHARTLWPRCTLPALHSSRLPISSAALLLALLDLS